MSRFIFRRPWVVDARNSYPSPFQVVESMGTAGYVFISGQVAATLHSYDTLQVGAYIGISNIFLLSTFIYATAAITGGHLNPLVTFSAIFAGICPFSRGWFKADLPTFS